MPEPDIADMEFFIEQAGLILPILGLELLRPKPTVSVVGTPYGVEASGEVGQVRVEIENKKPPIFIIKAVGVSAKMSEVDGMLIVQQGSTARAEGTPSWNDTPSRMARDRLIEEGILQSSDEDGVLVFTENVEFKTPTAAAETVVARSENGRTAWKLEGSDKTYADWQEERVTSAIQD